MSLKHSLVKPAFRVWLLRLLRLAPHFFFDFFDLADEELWLLLGLRDLLSFGCSFLLAGSVLFFGAGMPGASFFGAGIGFFPFSFGPGCASERQPNWVLVRYHLLPGVAASINACTLPIKNFWMVF